MMLCEKYKEQFLQPEVRCDTYIGIEMKQVWFAELQLLEKFIDVCNKHGLSYQLVGGSLLGAIRHKGFIPWDDDIDVGMLRPDYDRFVQLAKNELEAPFFLQTPLTDPGRNIDYVQIRNSATTAIDLRYVDDHNTFNQGIFIDIFPIDGVGSDEVLQKQEKQQQFIRRVYGSAFKTNATGKAKIKHYVSNAIYKIAGSQNIDKKRNDIFRKVGIESSNEIGLVVLVDENFINTLLPIMPLSIKTTKIIAITDSSTRNPIFLYILSLFSEPNITKSPYAKNTKTILIYPFVDNVVITATVNTRTLNTFIFLFEKSSINKAIFK